MNSKTLSKENKCVSVLKKIFLSVFFLFCLFGLTSCSSVEKKGISTNFTVVRCTYDATKQSTTIVWSSSLENESIYDMKEVYFKFDLYKDGSYIRTTDYVHYDIQIKHGKTNTGKRSFIVDGDIDNIQIYSWYADFATLWQSYKWWFIGTIIGASILAVLLIILLIASDGDILDVFEDHIWILWTLIPVSIVIILSTGIVSIIARDWVSFLIVIGGIVAAFALFGLAALVAYIIDEI